jgi:hypothetical protein
MKWRATYFEGPEDDWVPSATRTFESPTLETATAEAVSFPGVWQRVELTVSIPRPHRLEA